MREFSQSTAYSPGSSSSSRRFTARQRRGDGLPGRTPKLVFCASSIVLAAGSIDFTVTIDSVQS